MKFCAFSTLKIPERALRTNVFLLFANFPGLPDIQDLRIEPAVATESDKNSSIKTSTPKSDDKMLKVGPSWSYFSLFKLLLKQISIMLL